MNATIPAYLIPVDGRTTGPMELPTADYGYALHGPNALPEADCSPVDAEYHDDEHGTTHLSFWFDEYTSPDGYGAINIEAMRVIDAFVPYDYYAEYLALGNCIVTSFNPDTGLSEGLPNHVVDALARAVPAGRK